MNVVATDLQLARHFLVRIFTLLAPTEQLPGRGGPQRSENIDPSTASIITAENPGWPPSILMPVLSARAAGATLSQARRASLQLLQKALGQLCESGFKQAFFLGRRLFRNGRCVCLVGLVRFVLWLGRRWLRHVGQLPRSRQQAQPKGSCHIFLFYSVMLP
jgi:hypothetical protein